MPRLETRSKSSWLPRFVLATMIDVCLQLSLKDHTSLCQDGVDWNCQQFWKTTTMVCYECIHCHLFIAVLLSILDTFCHAILRNCRIAIYILHMLSAEVNILHTGEASGHTMICISRLWDKRADIFHIEVYIPSEEAIFCCYCNLYFKCRDYIWCWVLKLLLYLEVPPSFQVWRLYLMHFNARFDAFCLRVRQSSSIWKAKALFWKS